MCASQSSLNFVAIFFFLCNKLLLQITPKVKKHIHKLQWQKAWQRLHAFGNKCTFFSLVPTLEKKIYFCPSIIADAHTPRNAGEGAYKRCPVAITLFL